MIVRAVLQDPSRIDRFDYFNNAKDTIWWLKNQIATPEALAIAKRLEDGFEKYLDAYAARLKGNKS